MPRFLGHEWRDNEDRCVCHSRLLDDVRAEAKALEGRMIERLLGWLRGLFDRSPVHLAIVRRYKDANGHYVGELYMYGTFAGVGSYRMVGCSLDSFPLELGSLSLGDEPGALDLLHDFMAPMQPNTLRVGAPEPKDNDNVRRMIGKLPRRNIRLVLQNKFIEHALDRKTV
jgi:hypothetical protein